MKLILSLLTLFIFVSCTSNDTSDFELNQNLYENNKLKDFELFENAKEFIKKVSNKNKELAKELININSEPYIVFHDAYQYFEADYDLNSVGSISLNPEISPTPKRIKEIKANFIICKYTRQNVSNC